MGDDGRQQAFIVRNNVLQQRWRMQEGRSSGIANGSPNTIHAMYSAPSMLGRVWGVYNPKEKDDVLLAKPFGVVLRSSRTYRLDQRSPPCAR